MTKAKAAYVARINTIWSNTRSVKRAGECCEAILDDLSIAAQAEQITEEEYGELRRAALAEHDAHVPVWTLGL